MNILVSDSQGLLSVETQKQVHDRLLFALARFAFRLNGATIHVSKTEGEDQVNCLINVNIENRGIVSANRNSETMLEAVELAVDAIEPKVACRVNWRSWFNADTFATWFVSVSETLTWTFGVDQKTSYRQSP